MTLIAIASFTIFVTFSICAAMEQEDNRRSDDFDTIQHFFGQSKLRVNWKTREHHYQFDCERQRLPRVILKIPTMPLCVWSNHI